MDTQCLDLESQVTYELKGLQTPFRFPNADVRVGKTLGGFRIGHVGKAFRRHLAGTVEESLSDVCVKGLHLPHGQSATDSEMIPLLGGEKAASLRLGYFLACLAAGHEGPCEFREGVGNIAYMPSRKGTLRAICAVVNDGQLVLGMNYWNEGNYPWVHRFFVISGE